MFCIKCGTQLPEGAAFCFSCGSAVWNGSAQGTAPAPAAQPESGFQSLGGFSMNTSAPAPVAAPVSAAADKAVPGTIFAEGDKLYFLAHGYCTGQRSEFWCSDLNGKNSKCLINFEDIGYGLNDMDFNNTGTCYPMVKIGSRIYFGVYKGDDEFNYYYDLSTGKHSRKLGDRLPYYISDDCSCFYKSTYTPYDGIQLTLYTPEGALNGESYSQVTIDSSTMPELFAVCGEGRIQNNESDMHIFNKNQLIVPIAGDEYWSLVRINLSDLSDYHLYRNEGYYNVTPDFCCAGSKVMLYGCKNISDRENHICIVDTLTDTIVDRIDGVDDYVRPFDSDKYILSGSGDDSILYDMTTGTKKIINTHNCYALNPSSFNSLIFHNGISYCYDFDRNTNVYSLPVSQWFAPCEDTYGNDESLLIISLKYTREFEDSRGEDDNRVYTTNNTSELKLVWREKMKEIGADNFSFYGSPVTLVDGNTYGFKYNHAPEYKGAKEFYYNLYHVDPQGNYRFLNCGSRGGIESLMIYKNYAYWYDYCPIRCDLNTGEVTESHDQWLKDEYNSVKKMANDNILL